MKQKFEFKTYRGRIEPEELDLWMGWHKLTKKELALALGVRPQTISNWCSSPYASNHARTPIGLHDELVKLFGPPAPPGVPSPVLTTEDDPHPANAARIASIELSTRGSGPLRPRHDQRDLSLYIQLCKRQWLKGVELQTWMFHHKVNANQLADAIGVTPARVEKWCHDRPAPRKGLIALLVTKWGEPWPPVIEYEED